MKIAIVPDCHLNKSIYKGVMDKEFSDVPFRSADFMRAFRYIVDKCVNELHPDLFVIPGDTYENWHPSNEIRGFLSKQVAKLRNAKIAVVILIGNHEICSKNHALQDIQELGLKSIRIVDRPAILNFKELRLLLFPYSLDIEQKKITLRDEFHKFVEGIKEQDNQFSIFFGHCGVQGAKLNEYTISSLVTRSTTTEMEVDKREFKNKNPNDLTLEDLDSIGAEYVILGDYHQHQLLETKNCISMYPGSIEKTDFTEVDQKKGFILYDSDAEYIDMVGKCRFVEYPKCRPMIELKGNFMDMRQKFSECKLEDFQEAIVKLNFVGSKEEHASFSSGIEDFQKEIREKINPIHMFNVQDVQNEEEEEAASELVKEIMEKGHLQADDVMNVVKEMVKEKVSDDEECEKTIDLGIEIYKDTMGEPK